MTQSLQNRIERAEEAAKAHSRFSRECSCFPKREQPSFNWPIEQRLAAEVKCPLHGERFRPVHFCYVAKWLRDKRQHLLQTHHGEQYRKAWIAGFSWELWPAEEVLIDGHIALRLKDGTTLPIA
jgi:hypothetical protein